MSIILKDELFGLKSKLENLEQDLTNQMMEVELRAEEWHKHDEQVFEFVKKNKDKVITLNVGGKEFQTKIETLLSLKDSLFTKILISGKLPLEKPIFIDRSYDYFPYIMSFLRNKKLVNLNLKTKQLNELYEEAKFYEIDELVEFLEEIRREIKFVKFEASGTYDSSGRIAGTNRIEDINNFEDRSLTKGICTSYNGWILFEINREVEFEDFELGGWNGDTSIWGVSNGSGSSIKTSVDKVNWNTVGTIPNNFGSTILDVKVTRSRAKYVKFESTSYLGIGYFKIKKL